MIRKLDYLPPHPNRHANYVSYCLSLVKPHLEIPQNVFERR